MFITNGKEYVNIDSIVYIERAHFDHMRASQAGFYVVTESIDGKREKIAFKDIYSDDVNAKLKEILVVLIRSPKYKWVVFEGDKSIYRINHLKYITEHSENSIKFATDDGVFTVYGRNQQELTSYKQMLISNKQFLPENIDISHFF